MYKAILLSAKLSTLGTQGKPCGHNITSIYIQTPELQLGDSVTSSAASTLAAAQPHGVWDQCCVLRLAFCAEGKSKSPVRERKASVRQQLTDLACGL